MWASWVIAEGSVLGAGIEGVEYPLKRCFVNHDNDLRSLLGGPRETRFRADEPDLPRHAAVRRHRLCRMAAPTGWTLSSSRIRAGFGAPVRPCDRSPRRRPN